MDFLVKVLHSRRRPNQLPQGNITPRQGSGEEIAQALRQVISAPKVEYMRFDGNPMKYVSFMHNFETCLEKDNPDNTRRLQLLIQHCYGKAREAIESCVNLPVEKVIMLQRTP